VGEKPTFLLRWVREMLAADKTELMTKLTELGEQAALGTSIEVLEIQLRGAGKARLLRVYIDKPGGVTHGDCELISERFGGLLDREDAIPGESYTLEVSSPGVERKLTRPRDFERVIGQKIRVAVRDPIEGQTHFAGTLTGFTGQMLEIEITPQRVVRVPLDQVQKANLKFEGPGRMGPAAPDRKSAR
jgi:ribosome maturation factor RimP